MTKQRNFAILILIVLATFALNTNAQVEALEGNWITDAGIEGVEYGVLKIDSKGNVSGSETHTYTIDGTDTIFDVEHTGKITVNEDDQYVYAGIGIGTARDSNGTIRVRLQVAGSGMVSVDDNMLAGFWVSVETYITPDGEIHSEGGYPMTLIREGYDPGTPGEAIAGTWKISIQGENLGWTGEVTLNPDGTMAGEYTSDANLPSVPLSGFFSYSEDHHFECTYTTTTELPTVGETTFTLSCEGQGNEDNTYITGTWSFEVDVTDFLSMTFDGTFDLTKIEETGIHDWNLY